MAGMAEGDSTSKAAPNAAPPGAPPQGRTGEVEEADIYKVDQNRLFYLNTYRGFVIYDVADPKKPQRLSRLPVYGYPIEMFISKTTVYALLRDALYLTQENGRLEFKRHNVSQLVAIDISDLKNPKVLKTVDIFGQLREGVSRKIEDTVYVVSYQSQSYWWGWGYSRPQKEQPKEQAWVYSFNVADPKNPALVDKLQVFEGGSYQFRDPLTGSSASKNFTGVSISATSNALMVVENWQKWGYSNSSPGAYKCGSYQSSQTAAVSIVDISDPKGKIKLYTKFETDGQLTDQFKQTYVFDKVNNTGTYFGIFARQEWNSQNCEGGRFVRNTMESWDITNGASPKRISELSFGKPNETVRGTTYDVERQVAYAITAEAVDPLYVISFADRKNLKVLSAIDGLSGDMNVFRLIQNNQFLMGIGRDNSKSCTGFGSATTGWATNVAVSLIDVRDLTKIRLVQRKCVAVKNAEWVGSELNWNLDQAHKMIGMFSDDRANVISVPVYYYSKSDNSGWWWYDYKTAVGLMAWDLTKYDSTKSELDQQVLTNFGTVIHPHGQVDRSVVFTHKGATDRRMMINLSDTHISVVDVNDLSNPVLQSVVEVAPYHSQLFKFGKYIVEHTKTDPWGYWGGGSKSELRVKAAGGELEDSATVATLSLGGVQQVIQHKNSLVFFRYRRDQNRTGKTGPYGTPYEDKTEVLVYDFSNPAAPKQAGTVVLPYAMLPYYRFWCGMDGFWGGYWFDSGNDRTWTVMDGGLAFLRYVYDYQSRQSSQKLVVLDLRNLAAPKVHDFALSGTTGWEFLGLAPDPVDTQGFFLTYRTKVGETMINGYAAASYKYYAQVWSPSGASYSGGAAINLPGRLIKVWKNAGQKLFLTHDYIYRAMPTTTKYPQWRYDFRVNLLRQISPLGKPMAELLDTRLFTSFMLKDLVVDGSKLFINARHDWYYLQTNNIAWQDQSDHLMIFDLSKLTMN